MATCPFCGDECCVVPARAGWLCTRCGGEMNSDDWVLINQPPLPGYFQNVEDDIDDDEPPNGDIYPDEVSPGFEGLYQAVCAQVAREQDNSGKESTDD